MMLNWYTCAWSLVTTALLASAQQANDLLACGEAFYHVDKVEIEPRRTVQMTKRLTIVISIPVMTAISYAQ